MNRKRFDEDFTEIKRLIQKEKEESLQLFRKSGFSTRIRSKIREEEKKDFSLFLWLNKPLALIGVMLFIIISASIIIWQFSIQPSAPQSDWTSLKSFLERAPGFQNVWLEEREISFYEGTITETAKSISEVLTHCSAQISPGEKEAPSLLLKKEISPSEVEKKIGLLFKEKAIEHFLLNNLKERKEVSDASQVPYFRHPLPFFV